MINENQLSVWPIYHCIPIASFNPLDDNGMTNCINWINFRPIYSNENNSKKDEIYHYLYLCQEVNTEYFLN